MNKITLIGRFGSDVKLHHFESSGCVGSVSMATEFSYKDKTSGERISKTEWHNLFFWNKAAEIIEKHVKKGHKLAIEGRLTYRNYTSDAGEKHTVAEIQVTEFTFLQEKEKTD